MEVKTRIQNAFLSEKNAESVFDQIVTETESKSGGDLRQFYEQETLWDFQVSMMNYLWGICSPQLQDAHLINPKKTVFLLNALTVRRVVKAVCIRLKERPAFASRALTTFPVLPTSAYALPDNIVGSIPIGCLAPKRKTVRISKLAKDSGPLHVFWRRPDQRRILEQKYAQEVGFCPLPYGDGLEAATATYANVRDNLPWRFVTVSSKDRTFGCTEAYTVSPEGLTNLYRLCLHKVEIPLAVPLLSCEKRFFYFSEDDEPMHAIDLSSDRFSNKLQTILVALQDEMNDIGRHAYRITKEKFTNRVKIAQITRMSGIKGRFSLLFEQTKDNCADLMGFKSENYQGEASYEGSEACWEGLYSDPDVTEDAKANINGTVSVRIPQMSDQPIIQLSAVPGSDSRKIHEFDNYVLYENLDIKLPGLSLPALSVAFSTDDIVGNVVIGEHQFIFKCWYFETVLDDIDDKDNEREGEGVSGLDHDEHSVTESETSISTATTSSHIMNCISANDNNLIQEGNISDKGKNREIIQKENTSTNSQIARPRRRKLPPLNLPQ